MDLRPLLDAKPDYLFSGHSHIADESYHGVTRRINPGALAEADEYSVAVLDLETDVVQFIPIRDERLADRTPQASRLCSPPSRWIMAAVVRRCKPWQRASTLAGP